MGVLVRAFLAPVRLGEAADSLVKASSPQPFSASKDSNWVARAGGLPPYVQHIAHALMADPKHPRTESEAIQTAMGIVKNPPAAWDATAKAACAKAVGELATKKAGTAAKGAVKESLSLADRGLLRAGAHERLAILREALGVDAMAVLVEGTSGSFAPELKRVASADREKERLEVHDGGQHVGTLTCTPSYDKGRPDRWAAKTVSGRGISDVGGLDKKGAMDALKKHLEDAPGRISPSPTKGRFLVGTPSSYGKTSYAEFPSESSARYEAGLPEGRTKPESDAEVAALGEGIAFDLITLRALGGAVEQSLAEAVDESAEGAEKPSSFSKGDAVNYQHPNAGRVRASVTKVTSRHVYVRSSDPRVNPARMTHKQAMSKLSMTTKKVAESSAGDSVLGALLESRSGR